MSQIGWFEWPLRPGYILELGVVLVAQNAVTNRTRVVWALGIRQLGGPSASGSADWSATVAGNTLTGSVSFDFAVLDYLDIAAGTSEFGHEANGTIELSAWAEFVDHSGDLSNAIIGGMVPVPPIARASKVSVAPSPAAEGAPVTVRLDRASTSFTHDVTWVCGSLSGSIGTGVATEIAWTPPAGLLDEYPGRDEAPVTITAVTKNGAATLGSSTATLMIREVPSPITEGEFLYDVRCRRVVLVDGIPTVLSGEVKASTIKHSGVESGTASLSLTWSELADVTVQEFDILEAEVWDGAAWRSIGRFVMQRVQGDVADLSQVRRMEGIDYVDFVMGRGRVLPTSRYQDARDYSGVSVGWIVRDMIEEGHDRGWGPFLDFDFTAAATSIGTPWSVPTVARRLELGDLYLQVLEGFVEDGTVEYRTAYRNGKAWLELVNPGTGSDWADDAANPVVNLSLAQLSKAPRKATIEDIVTRMTGQGEGTLRRTLEVPVPELLEAVGHLEGWTAAGGVTDPVELDRIVQAGVESTRPTDERTFTYSVNANDRRFWPYFTLRPGDWILVPGTDGTVRERVAEITLTRGEDGDVEAAIIVGDRIPSGLAGVARRQRQSSGGSVPGGTLAPPSRLDAAIPAAPTSLSLSTVGYWDPTGRAKAKLEVSWVAVSSALDGSPVTVAAYEVWSRPSPTVPWTMLTLAGEPSAEVWPLDVNTALDVRVRAKSAAGVDGAWSLYQSVVLPEPDEPLPAPSTPVVTADAVGTVTIAWDGLLDGNPPPIHYAYTLARIATTEHGAYSPAGSQLLSAGQTTVAGVGEGTYWVHLVAFDTLGVASALSTAVPVEIAAIPFDTREPAAPTGLVADSDAQWTSTAPTARLLAEWDAVTDDVDGDPITVILYEMWGRIVGEEHPRLLTAATELEAVYAPVDLGSDWLVSVRAQSATRVWGPFSAEVPVTAAEPAFDATAPSPLIVGSSRGNVHVSSPWTLDGTPPVAIPSWVTQLIVEGSTEEDGTYSPMGILVGVSQSIPLPGFAVGSTAWVRARAVDRLGRVSDPSEAQSVLVVGVAGPDIEANSVSTNHLVAGSIEVDRVSPSFGRDLAIDGNVTITSAAARIDSVEADAAETAAGLAQQQLVFQVLPDHVRIGRAESPFDITLDDEEMAFREQGVARATLSAGQWRAESIVSPQIIMGPHVIEHDGTSLLFRRT